MTVHRFAARRDTNESKLVAIAEKLGAIWVYGGPLDGWCFHAKTGWVPVEVKSPKGTYTESQARFMAKCYGYRAPYWTWRIENDVLKCLGAK
jgi:hypothetical protein